MCAAKLEVSALPQNNQGNIGQTHTTCCLIVVKSTGKSCEAEGELVGTHCPERIEELRQENAWYCIPMPGSLDI